MLTATGRLVNPYVTIGWLQVRTVTNSRTGAIALELSRLFALIGVWSIHTL